jgi:uncharacterized membrane protein YgcG
MARIACFACLLAICLFAVSPLVYADGVRSFNHAASDCDLSISDVAHSNVDHDHGNGNAWAWGHQKNGNDNDAEDNDQGSNGNNNGGNNGGSGNGGMCGGGYGNNGGGSNSGSGGGSVSMPEPSALLLLMLGLAALFIGNFKNSLRKLSV